MKIKLKLTVLIASLGLFSQCKVFDNEVIVPGYVYIGGYKMETAADGSQGDSTSKIVDAWVYDNGSVVGSFGLPALIPIQKTGAVEIGIDAGILKSGQNYERIPNPIIARWYASLNLKPNTIDTIFPVFKYTPRSKFKLIEDFDRVGFRFTKTYSMPGDTIVYINSGADARTPGQNSGMVMLTDSTDYFRLVTTDPYILTGLNLPSILELDYNSDVILYIGMFANVPGGVKQIPLYNAYPTTGWNKVYINTTDEVSLNPINTEYKIYIDVYRTIGSPQPKIILDNIKLIEG
ncbi:MAG: hypothetical protein KBE91_07550 [Bacteroidia bacterium]|nr:hypothetical protein [Bacteroidia bacterium]MBP9689448.1 hypothetical protein [Bacteroidia bacterium]